MNCGVASEELDAFDRELLATHIMFPPSVLYQLLGNNVRRAKQRCGGQTLGHHRSPLENSTAPRMCGQSRERFCMAAVTHL